ncbi:hypothetical protein HRbin12_01666 [bacterium HR12]|nr:hypothetical protein HRbin12_01666 [bacterium HR12]GIV01040.1 MAG: hypothetical protein KatS3mg014_2655 [Actinomycetota bacterium]
MLESVRVWAVELGLGPPVEREGTLALGADALRFEPSEPGPAIALPLAEIVRVRRLRGSPVLMVVSRRGDERRRTAFYFAPPPPLPGAEEQAQRLALPFRSPRRRARRRNVTYLGLMSREKRELLVAWERGVRAAVDAARRA